MIAGSHAAAKRSVEQRYAMTQRDEDGPIFPPAGKSIHDRQVAT